MNLLRFFSLSVGRSFKLWAIGAHICHFSPHMQFLVKFSPHKSARIATKHILRQNSVNCDKNDCTTKQNKFYIYVETFSTSHTCKRWRNFRFVHICDVDKLEISPYVDKLEISPYVEKLQISPYLSHLEISPHDKFLYIYIGGIVDKYEVCSTWPLTVSRFALFFVLVSAILHVSCDAANALILPCFA